MKIFIHLLLAVGLFISLSTSVYAADIKPSLKFALNFTGTNASEDASGAALSKFNALQRFRVGFKYQNSNMVSAFIQLESNLDAANNTNYWGQSGYKPAGLQPVGIRMAYIDWVLPNSDIKVRMGKQSIQIPSYVMGSPFYDDTAPSIALLAKFTDYFSASIFWMRTRSETSKVSAEADTFALMAHITFDGFSIIPYGTYSLLGKNTFNTPPLDDVSQWLLGTAFQLTVFDPIIFAIDAYYGETSSGSPVNPTQSGFYAAGSIAYSMTFGTPSLKMWYASGEKGQGSSTSMAPHFPKSGGIKALTWYFNGTNGLGGTYALKNNLGSTGLIAEWADISFFKNIEHTVRFSYILGTNADISHPDDQYSPLTSNDSLMEVDINTTYSMYQNLAATLELAYILPSINDTPSTVNTIADSLDMNSIFYAGLIFNYNF